MNVQGPGSSPRPLPLPGVLAGSRGASAKPAAEARPSDAPEAQSLWELLTPEERTFFEQLATLGTLTYAPGPKADERAAAAPTGRRVDVRA